MPRSAHDLAKSVDVVDVLGLHAQHAPPDKQIRERNQLRVLVGGRAAEPDGKGANSRRTIALDILTVAALRRHLATIDAEREAWGDSYPTHGLLFVYPDGRPMHPDTITRRFNRLVDRAGRPHPAP
jgi:integrase